MQYLEKLSIVVLPVIIIGIILIGFIKKVDCFGSFTEGAKDGITTTLNILPSLVGLMVAIAVFRESGALDLLVKAVSPLANLASIPEEVLPLAFMRPISGGASLALLGDMFKQYGPDSIIGKMASTMMGSSETVFYTVAVYLSGAGIKKTEYIIPVALISNAIGVLIASRVVYLFFG